MQILNVDQVKELDKKDDKEDHGGNKGFLGCGVIKTVNFALEYGCEVFIFFSALEVENADVELTKEERVFCFTVLDKGYNKWVCIIRRPRINYSDSVEGQSILITDTPL